MTLKITLAKLLPHLPGANECGLILGLCPANERRRYKVTPSLIGWAVGANLEFLLSRISPDELTESAPQQKKTNKKNRCLFHGCDAEFYPPGSKFIEFFLAVNSLRAKFFRGNINIYRYLHFMSLLHTDMTQVLKILPHARPGSNYSVNICWCPGYVRSQGISSLEPR